MNWLPLLEQSFICFVQTKHHQIMPFLSCLAIVWLLWWLKNKHSWLGGGQGMVQDVVERGIFMANTFQDELCE